MTPPSTPGTTSTNTSDYNTIRAQYQYCVDYNHTLLSYLNRLKQQYRVLYKQYIRTNRYNELLYYNSKDNNAIHNDIDLFHEFKTYRNQINTLYGVYLDRLYELLQYQPAQCISIEPNITDTTVDISITDVGDKNACTDTNSIEQTSDDSDTTDSVASLLTGNDHAAYNDTLRNRKIKQHSTAAVQSNNTTTKSMASNSESALSAELHESEQLNDRLTTEVSELAEQLKYKVQSMSDALTYDRSILDNVETSIDRVEPQLQKQTDRLKRMNANRCKLLCTHYVLMTVLISMFVMSYIIIRIVPVSHR